MTITQDALAGLSLAEKRALLLELLQKSQDNRTVFPLSHGQRGLWFLHELDPHNPAYNICHASRFRSPLDLPAFCRTLRKLIDRHRSLRTTFEVHDGVLRQRVSDQPPLPLEVIEASSWTEAALLKRLEAEADRPFDLTQGPLLRMHLFRRAPTITSSCSLRTTSSAISGPSYS